MSDIKFEDAIKVYEDNKESIQFLIDMYLSGLDNINNEENYCTEFELSDSIFNDFHRFIMIHSPDSKINKEIEAAKELLREHGYNVGVQQ